MTKENNIYYMHRKEIKEVSDDLNLPVDIASDIVRRRHGWPETGAAANDLTEWRKLCREYQLTKGRSLRELFEE